MCNLHLNRINTFVVDWWMSILKEEFFKSKFINFSVIDQKANSKIDGRKRKQKQFSKLNLS